MLNLRLNDIDILNLQRELARRSLHDYIKMCWPVIEPGVPFVDNWHVGAMAEHLQACDAGQITRLLINIPPGTMKSTVTGVIFPSWLWGPAHKAYKRFVGASHEQTLATRDNRKTRLLVESKWFQRRWTVPLVSDQNEKTYFENSLRGFRQSSAVASMTGRRGDYVLWDDPHSPEKAYSDSSRETTIRVFKETLPSRVNDPVKSVIIVVMQRLHEGDVSGEILTGDYGYTHLCMPMEYEKGRQTYYNALGWKDPRKEEGELLFPGRFPREVVDRDKKVMGAFATAGQFQQRPTPREGGMFQHEWFTQFLKVAPAGTRWARGWDLAATDDDPKSARTAGVLMGEAPDGRIIVGDARAKRFGPDGVIKMVQSTAIEDRRKYKHVAGSVPQDPGAGGKSWAQTIVKALVGHPYTYSVEPSDKVTRAMGLSAQFEAGNVWLIEGDWNDEYIDEMCMFPGGVLKDLVDASSRAFDHLMNGSLKRAGILVKRKT